MRITASLKKLLMKKTYKSQADLKRETLERIGREQFQKLADRGLGIQVSVL